MRKKTKVSKAAQPERGWRMIRNIDLALWTAVRKKAKAQGKTLPAWVEEAFREKLEREKE
jgi:hypothetical protein